jgi:hypothetical protein
MGTSLFEHIVATGWLIIDLRSFFFAIVILDTIVAFYTIVAVIPFK